MQIRCVFTYSLLVCLLLVAVEADPSTLNGQEVVQPTQEYLNSEQISFSGEGEQIDELVRRLNEAESRLAALETPKTAALEKSVEKKAEKKWFEKINVTGYLQVRINETLSTEPGSAPAQYVGDSSVGEDQGFLIRRARLVFSGDISERISIYLQPDFASNVPGVSDSVQFAQIRDWYSDIHLDDNKEFRFRVGQSKIPYGWENMQSSRDRLPLDRNDALNSAARNERDLGVFFYWTPEYAQDFFKYIQDNNLKGSGNYGVFGFGFYNGQGGSFREQNDDLHMIARYTQPITFENGQLMELAVQGYRGMYTVLGSSISPLGVGPAVRPDGTLEEGNVAGIMDERIATTLVYYPQPFGFQAEWTVGRGPGLNNAQTEVIERDLYGGYGMFIYHIDTPCRGDFYPFARWGYYKGGYKTERNAPYSLINEWDLGLEWQISKNLEFVSMYTLTDRTNTRAFSSADTLSYGQFMGDLLRFQLQVRF